MATADTLRYTKIPLTHGSGAIPALGFGTLIPDPLATKQATESALEVGFRHLDCAERYRNEDAVGDAMQAAFNAGALRREDVFVTTKLWNTNHRPERVKPAFDASLRRLQLDYVDCYLIHTPFAFRPGDEQDPRDELGQVIYDRGVTLLETWQALERLVDDGCCKAIGLSDVTLEKVREIASAARIKPAVVEVESHPYLPEWSLLDFCRENGIVLLAFAALGHGMSPKVLEDPVITSIARRVTRRRLKFCWPGPCNAGPPFSLLQPNIATSTKTLRYRPCLKTPCGRSGKASRPTSDSTRWWGRACRDLFREPIEYGAAALVECGVAPRGGVAGTDGPHRDLEGAGARLTRGAAAQHLWRRSRRPGGARRRAPLCLRVSN